MGIKIANNAYGTLSGGITAVATSIALTAGHGARFPALGSTDYFFATLVDASGNVEIIKVTARATDTITAVRAQDGTTGRIFASGDRFEVRPCNAAMLALQEEAHGAVAAAGTDTYTASLPVAPNGYNTDQVYVVRFANANTVGNPTLNLNSIGAITIIRVGGGALFVGDIPVNHLAFLLYNGTNFVLLNPAIGAVRAASVGGTDAYTVAASLVANQAFVAYFSNANTSTAPTLIGITIKKANGAALSPGDIQANHAAMLTYNGTDVILHNPAKGHLRGKQTIWVPGSALTARSTSGATPASFETATNKINVVTMDFPDGTAKYAQFTVAMPKGWDGGTITAKFHWTKTTGTLDVVWQIQAVALGDNGAIDTAFGTAVVITDTCLTDNYEHISGDTPAMTVANTPAGRKRVVFQVFRDPTHASDTSAATAKLLGVEILVNLTTADDA